MLSSYKSKPDVASNHIDGHRLSYNLDVTDTRAIARRQTLDGIKIMSKVWFVTGAGSGIGAGIVKAALKAGDRVVATGRNLDRCARLSAARPRKTLPSSS
jgi:3-oxoacyl-ACP reductase-like protein